MDIYQKPPLEQVRQLLDENQLPTEDLENLNMEHFFWCGENDTVKAVIGLEIVGADRNASKDEKDEKVGLLRSLAVNSSVRGLGCGSALVKRLEEHAHAMGVEHLYLLTDTAEDYFIKKGYTQIQRESASDAIKRTKEFSGLCPASAAVMRKSLLR